MIKGLLDVYSWRARAFPVYLTIAPLALALVAVLPHGLSFSVGGGAAIVFVPLAYLLGQLGGDCGKRLEKRLWQKWGGPPTTRFLRHANDEFNTITRERIHERLRGLGLHIPSKKEEKDDPARADQDQYYQACTEELIRRTRDRKKFPLVFENLTDYGFRRNLLALKVFGLPITVIALLVCLWRIWETWSVQEPPVVSIVATLLILGLLLIWIFWVTEETVRIAANRYARSLLEATLSME